jgi:hypothetical protein
LGADDRLLRVPEVALAAPAHDQRRQVTLRRGAAAHVGREARQEVRERNGADLDTAARHGATLQEAERAPPLRRGVRRGRLPGRPARRHDQARALTRAARGGRRLTRVHTS